MRCTSTDGTIDFTSSGSTKFRPRIAATACDARYNAIEARGLGEAETREAERLILGPGPRAATIALSVVGSAAVSLLVALVSYLGAAYVLGGEGTFLATWSAAAHALLVGVVEWAVKLPVMLGRGRLEVLFGPALLHRSRGTK